MRSSKARSRSKSNRSRSVGNVVNRVFDSSGPEGKVRGTPQQIIDKYNQLARDAQLSNDRVATENFQQHAEHYLRLLSEAQREQEARREQQERENRERQAQRDRERAEREAAQGGGEGGGETPSQDKPQTGGEGESGLVETPESRPKPRRSRKPRSEQRSEGSQDGGSSGRDGGGGGSQEAAE
ncbi:MULTISPECIES: DUF4167 domain-containing protein [unclassified Rhodosalinus]|uniref:DUF4167 domain-containing protein n=1 Tax=unclassified Rhodosalinus TaxID=2630183 RepID=UPI003525279A